MPGTSTDVEPWEVHSELVLVSPEVWRRSLELLPERDPDAFLARPRQPLSFPAVPSDSRELAPGLAVAVGCYGLWRIGQVARTGFVVVAIIVALAVLAELLH